MAEVRESYLLRIASDPPARVWSGFGNLEIPADIVEPEPATYLGFGQMLSAVDFQYLINGVAERLEFSVSGVDTEMVRLAQEDAYSTKNAAVHLGRIDFDENWQQVGDVEWEAVFRADSITVESQGDGGKRVRIIKLSVGTDDTGRSYAPMAFFTDADQRRRSPTDLAFVHVAGINGGTTRRFGSKS
jgi:hypothetical protein